MGKHIKFDYVNEHGDFEKLLSQFGIDYDKKGTQLRALCPFHEDTKNSFSVTLEADDDVKANTWHCFNCNESGSIIDFAAQMTDGNLREGAMFVAEISGCALAPPKNAKAKKPQRARSKPKNGQQRKSSSQAEEPREEAPAASDDLSEINPPLKFELPLDPEHSFITDRLPSGVALSFGIGICNPQSRSMMAGRCCVPIHNFDGELVAYAGRNIGEGPQWLLPEKFKPQLCLFNAHRVKGASAVALVPGYFDVMQMHALRVPAVSILGSAISNEQVALLRQLGVERIAILFDGDAQAYVTDVVSALSSDFYVRAPGSPGDDLSTLLRELRLL